MKELMRDSHAFDLGEEQGRGDGEHGRPKDPDGAVRWITGLWSDYVINGWGDAAMRRGYERGYETGRRRAG